MGADTATPTSSPPAPPQRVEILGVPLAVSDYDEVIAWMDAMVASGARGWLTAAAVNLVMSAHDDPSTMRTVRDATLAVPDGQPLVWALRLLGHRGATRVYGPDLMIHHCAHAASTGTQIFLYGGRSEQALTLLTDRLRARVNAMSNRAALHEDDRMVAILAHHCRGQPEDKSRLCPTGHKLKARR